METKLYIYKGPVVSYFGETLSRLWTGRTRALSPKQALSRLAYQYKMQNGFGKADYVSLPGKLM